MTQSYLSNSKSNSQQNKSQTSKGGSNYITRAVNNASNMGWGVGNTTSWNAATLGGNPLSPENYLSTFRWGNGSNPTAPYIGAAWSINRYVSMADFSTSGGTYTGRYHGAPNISSGISDFNYRFNMSDETGWSYGRDTKTTCPKMELFHSFFL